MELFLWRHADALPGSADFERELSPLGHEQARMVAEWFREHAPADLRILVSPAVRTRQTVAHFWKVENDLQLCPPLYENASPHEILSILGWPDMTAPTLIVGHQPQIGMLADHLLADTPHPDYFHKGALWRLRFEGKQNSAQLVHVMEP
jgi:phosphohistidine phosphatase